MTQSADRAILSAFGLSGWGCGGNRAVINAEAPIHFGVSGLCSPFDILAAACSPACQGSTIGALGLNFSVRNGKRCTPVHEPP